MKGSLSWCMAFSHRVLSSFVWGLCLLYCWWILFTMPLRQWKIDWIGRLPAYFSQGHQYAGQGARELKIPPCLIFNQWPLFSGNRKMYNPELLIGLIPLCYSWEGMFCFFIIKQNLISQMLSSHYNPIWRVLQLTEYKVGYDLESHSSHIEFWFTIIMPHKAKILALNIFWNYHLWPGLGWDEWETHLGHKI